VVGEDEEPDAGLVAPRGGAVGKGGDGEGEGEG